MIGWCYVTITRACLITPKGADFSEFSFQAMKYMPLRALVAFSSGAVTEQLPDPIMDRVFFLHKEKGAGKERW